VSLCMHPVFTHVPPNLWRSIMATSMPAAANRAAKRRACLASSDDDCVEMPRHEAAPLRKTDPRIGA
jgi:hypothetical protein